MKHIKYNLANLDTFLFYDHMKLELGDVVEKLEKVVSTIEQEFNINPSNYNINLEFDKQSGFIRDIFRVSRNAKNQKYYFHLVFKEDTIEIKLLDLYSSLIDEWWMTTYYNPDSNNKLHAVLNKLNNIKTAAYKRYVTGAIDVKTVNFMATLSEDDDF